MILAKPKIGHFKAMMEADRDFASAGEEPYCGCHGRMGYMAWLALVDKQSKPEYLDYGGNPNEIYLLLDDAERICGFGQLRMFLARQGPHFAHLRRGQRCLTPHHRKSRRSVCGLLQRRGI